MPAPVAALLATLCETTPVAAAAARPLEETIVG
jgi:hypothetical protein